MEKTIQGGSASRNIPAAGEASVVQDGDEETWSQAWGLVHGFNVTMTVRAAIDLGLLDALTNAAGRALTAEELAAPLPAADKAEAAASVDRILRLLASLDVVRCSTEVSPSGEAVVRRYTPAPVCRWLTSDHRHGSLAPMVKLSVDPDYIATCHQLGAAVAGGGPTTFERAHGAPMFEYLGRNPRLSSLFNQGMTQMSIMFISKLLERFHGFDGIGVLVDVGGGTGATLERITSRHKHIRGINFDLPYVISQAPTLPGVENIGGNMFEKIPSGDAMFLKNDEECIKILKNCQRALPDNGKVIIMEVVLPATIETTRTAQDMFFLDMIMLNNFREGKERTEYEFIKLARDAGFNGAYQSTYIFGNLWALEFSK